MRYRLDGNRSFLTSFAAEPKAKWKKSKRKKRGRKKKTTKQKADKKTKRPRHEPNAEENSDREIEKWTDEDFFRVFPLYKKLEQKRNADYFEAWRLCPAFQIRRTSRLTTRFFDQEIDERTPDEVLRSTQIPVLCAIRECKGERMREIARRLVMDPSTLTRSVDILERRGLVKRDVLKKDRRVRTVALTKEGERVLLLNLGGWRASRSLLTYRFVGDQPSKILEERAFRGVTRVFDAARRCMHARGYRQEMHSRSP